MYLKNVFFEKKVTV